MTKPMTYRYTVFQWLSGYHGCWLPEFPWKGFDQSQKRFVCICGRTFQLEFFLTTYEFIWLPTSVANLDRRFDGYLAIADSQSTIYMGLSEPLPIVPTVFSSMGDFSDILK
jgi:hypothetical protein